MPQFIIQSVHTKKHGTNAGNVDTLYMGESCMCFGQRISMPPIKDRDRAQKFDNPNSAMIVAESFYNQMNISGLNFAGDVSVVEY